MRYTRTEGERGSGGELSSLRASSPALASTSGTATRASVERPAARAGGSLRKAAGGAGRPLALPLIELERSCPPPMSWAM